MQSKDSPELAAWKAKHGLKVFCDRLDSGPKRNLMTWNEAKQKADEIMRALRAQFPPESIRLILRALSREYQKSKSMRPDPIKLFEQRVAENGGQMPKTVTLTHYSTFEDWHLPAEDGPATEDDFREARQTTDRFAEELTRRGINVIGVEFNRSDYDAWRGNRLDTRNLRAEWAIHPEEPKAGRGNKLQLAFVVKHDSVSWAVIKERK